MINDAALGLLRDLDASPVCSASALLSRSRFVIIGNGARRLPSPAWSGTCSAPAPSGSSRGGWCSRWRCWIFSVMTEGRCSGSCGSAGTSAGRSCGSAPDRAASSQSGRCRFVKSFTACASSGRPDFSAFARSSARSFSRSSCTRSLPAMMYMVSSLKYA